MNKEELKKELIKLNQEGLIGTQIKRDILEAQLKGIEQGRKDKENEIRKKIEKFPIVFKVEESKINNLKKYIGHYLISKQELLNSLGDGKNEY